MGFRKGVSIAPLRDRVIIDPLAALAVMASRGRGVLGNLTRGEARASESSRSYPSPERGWIAVRPLGQVLTGYATFVSDPHFLTNDLLDQESAEQVMARPIPPPHPHARTPLPCPDKPATPAASLGPAFFSPCMAVGESEAEATTSFHRDLDGDGGVSRWPRHGWARRSSRENGLGASPMSAQEEHESRKHPLLRARRSLVDFPRHGHAGRNSSPARSLRPRPTQPRPAPHRRAHRHPRSPSRAR